MTTVLVVGAGYAGFYAALHLERKLRPEEAEVVVVDPRPCMTYQPFLVRVLAVWLPALFFGRDIVSLQSVQHPRDAFVLAGVP